MDRWSMQRIAKGKHWFHQVMLERKVNAISFKPHSTADVAPPTPILIDDFKTLMQHNKLALQALNPKEKAALILRFEQACPEHQVAEILGLSQEALMGLFEQLSAKLHQQLRAPQA